MLFNILKSFELLDAVKNDCNSNNFSRRFTFIRDEKAISDVAEIKKDNNKLNHIYINENFCQYLWSVCVYLIAYFENVIHIPMMDAVGINKNGYKPNMIDVEYGNDCFSEDGNYYITLIEMHIGLLQISVIRSNLKIL